MAMSVGSSDEEFNSTINTTPLVDVMLVLLIIFLITIAVDPAGGIYWNNEQVGSKDQLIEMIKLEAVKDPQPEIHIRGDSNARFEDVGRVLYAVQRGGIVKVGFITEPDRGIRGSR